ncbi:MAG: hypothetical protein CVT59_01375 [Actinobacteria bacterium HGW-Actinobacteria-1]|jgi:uncharacterized protein YgiM (DUF1202 family)|nr:MAG: hypothetical protein CVT59_01375 [Actinobacteria bacterium HGW-Actinobacteria-1]
MAEPQSEGMYDLARIGRRLVAWALLVLLAAIAFSWYGDYRSAPKTPDTSTSSETTQSAEPTDVVDPSGEGTATGEATTPVVMVLAEGLNLRTKPMTNSDVIKKLKRGTALELLETANGWYRVRDDAGDEGWVAAGGNYTELSK